MKEELIIKIDELQNIEKDYYLDSSVREKAKEKREFLEKLYNALYE